MRDATTDAGILSSSHAWSGRPWEYASILSLRFEADGGGTLCYGFGQTIYALILCRWELPAPGSLLLTYLDSPPYQLFRGFSPDEGNRTRRLDYTLTEGEAAGVEDLLGQPYRFLWTLELSGSPYPEGLAFPYPPPEVYYGHRREEEIAPGASPPQ